MFFFGQGILCGMIHMHAHLKGGGVCLFFVCVFFCRKPKVYPPSRAVARPQARPAGAGGGVWGRSPPPQRRGAASVEKCPTSPLGQVPLRSHATFLPPLGRVWFITGAPTVVFTIYKPLPFVREFNLLKSDGWGSRVY